jgi:hypothetical protein
MRVGVFLLIASLTAAQAAMKKADPFDPATYSPRRYKVSQASLAHGETEIRVVNVRKLTPDSTAPHYCRTWVDIRTDGQLKKRISYLDIEPVGYSYGIFVPKVQKSPEYLTLVKLGDYDGRLLLVTRNGTVQNLRGGSFFVTVDGRFLVSDHSSDSPGLSVFDFRKGIAVLDTETVPYIQEWYRDASGYFFTESEWSGNTGFPHEKLGVAHRLDLARARVVAVKMTASELSKARKVKSDFDPRQYKDCTSEKE